jgi:tryptophanyl-tRNA synthetase
MELENKKIILSGVQPSGNLTIGHLAGALNHWKKMQEDYNCFYMIADLHTLTVRQEPKVLREKTLDTVAMYIACGINPDTSILFVQSHNPCHSQLQWILNCFTSFGECSKMTQFKDKSQLHSDNINVGLFAYPVLQASDILLYQADLVPVGEDQKQHLELTRNIAQRFNYHYSDTFKIPEPFIPKIGAKIMALQEPNKKMSKSDINDKNTIYLTDTNEQIINKIKRAVTDSDNVIKISNDKPGITNLITLYSISSEKNMKEVEEMFAGKQYGELKNAVGEQIITYIEPIRNKFDELKKNKDYLMEIITKGAEESNNIAYKTLRKVQKKVGLLSLK